MIDCRDEIGDLQLTVYRGILYSAQNIVKKDPGRAMQNSLAVVGTISPNQERIIKEISVQGRTAACHS